MSRAFPLRRLAAVTLALALAAPVLAAEEAKPAADPMAAWSPPKVKADGKDRQEVRALFAKMEAASMKCDLDAQASLIDFPVLMVTDDKKGEASAEPWSREQWVSTMKQFCKPMEGAKMAHKPTIVLLSDSLAVATDEWKMTMGKRVLQGRNATLLVRKGGEWKAKSMVEGGWGDLGPPADAAAK